MKIAHLGGPIVVAAVVASTAACGAGAPGSTHGGPTPASTVAPRATLHSADWQNVIRDVDCSSENRGVEVLGVAYGPILSPTADDAAVWVDCVHEASSWPSQLEVFDGSSDPSDPRQVAVLVSTNDNLQVRSVSISGGTVVVDAVGYRDSDPRCCPTLSVHPVYTWTGNRFQSSESATPN